MNFKWKLTLILFYFLVVAISEYFYRQLFYEKSLSIQKELQNKFNKDKSNLYQFSYIMTCIGAGEFLWESKRAFNGFHCLFSIFVVYYCR